MSERPLNILRTGEAATLLDATERTVKYLRPYLHALLLPSGTTRLALPYLEAAKRTMIQNPQKPIVALRTFAATPAASQAIEDGEAEFEIDLRHSLTEPFQEASGQTESAISLQALSAILDLSRHTIARWQHQTMLEPFRAGNQLYIGETALRGSLLWQRPQDYPGPHLTNLAVTQQAQYVPEYL